MVKEIVNIGDEPDPSAVQLGGPSMTDTIVFSAGSDTDTHKKLLVPDGQTKAVARVEVSRRWVDAKMVECAIPDIAIRLNDALDQVIAESGGDELLIQAIQPAAAVNHAAVGTITKIRKLVMECVGAFLAANLMLQMIETGEKPRRLEPEAVTNLVRTAFEAALTDGGLSLVPQMHEMRDDGQGRMREYLAKL